jgi:4-amino-4-deoxy-L-arabinose transferase-like glycosyltransferase
LGYPGLVELERLSQVKKQQLVVRWEHPIAILLVAAYLALAALFSVIVPVYETPDEPGHFDLIAQLINTKSLPVQNVERPNYAHHPPLYYILAAIPASLAGVSDNTAMPQLKPDFSWPGTDSPAVAAHKTAETFPYRGRTLAIHLARAVSVLCGALTVILTIAIGWLLFPGQPEVGLLAAALVAFNPQFLFISGAVTNDGLVIAACTGVLWQLLRTLQHPERLREWIFLGMWAAAALLAKSAALVVCGVVFLTWLIWSARRKSPALSIKSGMAVGLTFVALAGWWFVRNQVLYGDPLGWRIYQQAWAEVLRVVPLTVRELPGLYDIQFRSFWGVFGWMNVHPGSWLYAAARVLLLGGVIGWIVALRTGETRSFTTLQKGAVALFGAYIILQEAFIVYQNTIHNSSHAQGRYLFPVIAPLMLLVAFGIAALFPRKYGRSVLGVVSVSMAAISVFILFGVIKPAYHVEPLPKLSLLTVPHRTNVRFGDMFVLEGYAWEMHEADQKIQIRARLYWRAVTKPDFDYSVFVHALDANSQMLGQFDRSPGAQAGYPSSTWQVGDIVADTWNVEIPRDDWQNGVRLLVGVYNWQTGERLMESSGSDQVVLDLK